jgi:hypothetical protein
MRRRREIEYDMKRRKQQKPTETENPKYNSVLPSVVNLSFL